MPTGPEFRDAITQPSDRIIIAFDDMTLAEEDRIMSRVGDMVGVGKLNDGADLFGVVDGVSRLADYELMTMLDWKLHDTPGTARNRARNLAFAGSSLITVHTAGYLKMLEAAVEGVDQSFEMDNPVDQHEFLNDKQSRIGALLGITILTSLDSRPSPDGGPSEVELVAGGKLDEVVIRRARWAKEAGLTGVVCSGAGLAAIRSHSNLDDLFTVVPGMKFEGKQANDGQQQVATPEAAFDAGADAVVAGSALTKSDEKNGFPVEEAAARFVAAAERA